MVNADEGVGGTSLSSPLSAGVWARMETAHGNRFGFAAPIFCKVFGQPFGTAAKDFHDVTVGDSYRYPALPGWDYTTGPGTFNISAVNPVLPHRGAADPSWRGRQAGAHASSGPAWRPP